MWLLTLSFGSGVVRGHIGGTTPDIFCTGGAMIGAYGALYNP